MGYYDDTEIGSFNKQGEKERQDIKVKEERYELKRNIIKGSVYFLIISLVSVLLYWKFEWFFLLGVITPLGLGIYHGLGFIDNNINTKQNEASKVD